MQEIKKSTSDGFHNWENQVKYKLMSKCLWPYVIKHRVVALEKPKDVEENERSQASIALSFGKACIYHVENKSTAKAM